MYKTSSSYYFIEIQNSFSVVYAYTLKNIILICHKTETNYARMGEYHFEMQEIIFGTPHLRVCYIICVLHAQ